MFSTQFGVLQGIFPSFFFFFLNQLNFIRPKNSGQMTAYSLGRLQYNWTSEISRSFLCNIFPFPILITDGLVSVTGIIIICLSSRFLNKDGNCIHKPLFHTLLIHTLCLFTLHAWVAILSLKIHDNMLTRMLQAPTHFQIFSHASICIYRILITLTHGCQLPPCRIWCSQWCLPSLPTHARGGLLIHLLSLRLLQKK